MPKSNRYKIHFVYTQFIRGQKVLRDKTHFYEAPDGNAAIEKVERKYGHRVKILRIEKE